MKHCWVVMGLYLTVIKLEAGLIKACRPSSLGEYLARMEADDLKFSAVYFLCDLL